MLSSKEYKEYSAIETRYLILLQKRFYDWLNVDIKLDHCQSYKLHGHPLWIYLRNSFNESEDEWIPLVVDDQPFVPFSELKRKISRKHFKQVCDFVSFHSDLIKEPADYKIDFNGFVRNVTDLNKIFESPKNNLKPDVEELSKTSAIIDKFRVAPDPAFFVVFIRPDKMGLPPHIHIGDHATYPLCTQFHCIVNLHSPEYIFMDGECEDTLDDRQLNGFIRSLKSSDEDGESNWRFALKSWNQNIC